MFEKAFVHHELDWRYLSLDVAPESLEDAVRGIRSLGLCGGNCDGMHKEAVGRYLDRLGRSAELSGVVNCIRRAGPELIGENTEGLALLDSLRLRLDPAGKRGGLFGAGRMSRAVAIERAAAGAGQLWVVNRQEDRARELVELVTANFQVPVSVLPWQECHTLPADAEVMINATSIGNGDPNAQFPVDLDTLPAEILVADVTTNPPETWLLRQCEERGAGTVDGLEIFITQAAIDFKLWTGVNPDRTILREAVEEFLEL